MRKLKAMTISVFASGLALALPVFAQNASEPASRSMQEAGQSAKSAASGSGQAVEKAAEGTATVAKDSLITAKVKTALSADPGTSRDTIHVTTEGGVVTLKGQVASEDVSKRAEEVAEQTTGVVSVENLLSATTSRAMNQ